MSYELPNSFGQFGPKVMVGLVAGYGTEEFLHDISNKIFSGNEKLSALAELAAVTTISGLLVLSGILLRSGGQNILVDALGPIGLAYEISLIGSYLNNRLSILWN